MLLYCVVPFDMHRIFSDGDRVGLGKEGGGAEHAPEPALAMTQTTEKPQRADVQDSDIASNQEVGQHNARTGPSGSASAGAPEGNPPAPLLLRSSPLMPPAASADKAPPALAVGPSVAITSVPIPRKDDAQKFQEGDSRAMEKSDRTSSPEGAAEPPARKKNVSWASEEKLVEVTYIDTRLELIKSWDPDSQITLPFAPNTLAMLKEVVANEAAQACSTDVSSSLAPKDAPCLPVSYAGDGHATSFQAARQREYDMELKRALEAKEEVRQRMSQMKPTRAWQDPVTIVLPPECRLDPDAIEGFSLNPSGAELSKTLDSDSTHQSPPSPPPDGSEACGKRDGYAIDIPLHDTCAAKTPNGTEGKSEASSSDAEATYNINKPSCGGNDEMATRESVDGRSFPSKMGSSSVNTARIHMNSSSNQFDENMLPDGDQTAIAGRGALVSQADDDNSGRGASSDAAGPVRDGASFRSQAMPPRDDEVGSGAAEHSAGLAGSQSAFGANYRHGDDDGVGGHGHGLGGSPSSVSGGLPNAPPSLNQGIDQAGAQGGVKLPGGVVPPPLPPHALQQLLAALQNPGALSGVGVGDGGSAHASNIGTGGVPNAMNTGNNSNMGGMPRFNSGAQGGFGQMGVGGGGFGMPPPPPPLGMPGMPPVMMPLGIPLNMPPPPMPMIPPPPIAQRMAAPMMDRPRQKSKKRCKYFGTKQGCRDGSSCMFSHER